MCSDLELNLQTFGVLDNAPQSTEPPGQGSFLTFNVFSIFLALNHTITFADFLFFLES